MCLYVGQVRKLDYSLSGDKDIKKTGTNLVWKSSDKKIVAVNKKGEIKGKKAGKAKITAWIKGDSSTKASCKVKVKQFKEMNYSVPFGEVKYITLGLDIEDITLGLEIKERLGDAKSDMVNDEGYSKVIGSRKEWNQFLKQFSLKQFSMKKYLDEKGYSFDDIDFSENNILVYERWIQLVKDINKIDYSLVKNKSDVEVHIDVEYLEKMGVYYPEEINRCLVFEIMPKKFVESVNKLVNGAQFVRDTDIPQ
ncbi:MAG: Ig-like domain-containing protein [Lachnospiraceae bacterium]|nr:Ig-like domain-containing protein [Lachnospiraceae bacterium]